MLTARPGRGSRLCRWIRRAYLDRLLLDRVEQHQREPEVVVPEGSPRLGGLLDPVASVLVAAYVVDPVARSGVAPHGMPVEDPSEALDRLRRQLDLDRDRPAVEAKSDQVGAMLGVVEALLVLP
jgi:hypothetical protein